MTRQIYTIYDHLRLSKEYITIQSSGSDKKETVCTDIKHYIYPSPIPTDILTYSDGLKDEIPKKLNTLLTRCSLLKKKKECALESVEKVTVSGSFDEYFITSFILHRFSEYYVIQKWLQYWLSLWYKITDRPLPSKISSTVNKIEEWEKEKAKQNPIQNHFEGRLRRVGKRFIALCPFHQEKTPSFTIFPDNHWYCFGACNEGGDAIKFVMKLKGFTFPEAVRFLL